MPGFDIKTVLSILAFTLSAAAITGAIASNMNNRFSKIDAGMEANQKFMKHQMEILIAEVKHGREIDGERYDFLREGTTILAKENRMLYENIEGQRDDLFGLKLLFSQNHPGS